MAEIRIERLAHSYATAPQGPADWALDQLDHVWNDGGAYALLGPSGCGKTTLLNVISGLIAPTRGRVLFDGADVTGLSTKRRNIAQVFQFPVVYDTMTVFDNLAFPLRNRGADEATVRARVGEIAEMLDLGADLRRRANRLSADAKQKISLGRGLVRADVAAVLFDEPLTVIDPHMKWLLRRKLKEIHERLGLTLIYVTHDQNEALTFAERVAVMYQGRMLQFGTPQQLFEAPEHRFVGYFIGSPGMNFLPGEVDGDMLTVCGQRVAPAPTGLASNGPIEIGIRPEFVRPSSDPARGIEVEIHAIEDLGSFRIAACRLGAEELKMRLPEGHPVTQGRCRVEFADGMTRVYRDQHLVA